MNNPKILLNAKVAIVGLGKVGTELVKNLLKNGIREFILIDNATTDNIFKVDLLKDFVLSNYDQAKFYVIKEYLNKYNYSDILKNKNIAIICDCTTNPGDKWVTADICKYMNIPYISWSITDKTSWVSVIDDFDISLYHMTNNWFLHTKISETTAIAQASILSDNIMKFLNKDATLAKNTIINTINLEK